MREFSKQFQLRSYEIDFRGKIRPVVILNFLQDAAGDHAAQIGYSVTDLFQHNLTWVLSRYHIGILEYPMWRDELQIITWPRGIDGLFALRDFEVKNRDNKVLIAATSSWMVISLERKRPVRIEENLSNFAISDRRALVDGFEQLPALEIAELELPFRVRLNDLDLNRHVNNAVYAEWALETVPADILKNYLPVDIEISYRAEALYGDRVISRSCLIDSSQSRTFLHQLIREKDGRELTRLRSVWKRA